MTRILLLLLAAAAAAYPVTLPECRAIREKGELAEAKICFAKLAASPDLYLSAQGYRGIGDANQANIKFREAVKRNPKNAEYRVEWGKLYLEREQKGDAADLFEEALEISPDYPPALLGLATVAANSFEGKGADMARKALEKDPKLYQAHELLSRIAMEDSNEAKAIEEADAALAISGKALRAMAVRMTIDKMNGRDASTWIKKIEAVNPNYGEGWALAANTFVINRRYVEGIALYREALAKNPDLWDARSELGINLMRLGEENEAKELLVACYEAGWRTATVTNTLKLLDSYKNFVTFKSGNIILRLHKKEAELLRPYFEEELHKAVSTFEKKYDLKLAAPVQLEVYPDHEDFAVRTMGLPGLGALGVTFGNVVAMDSPSGRKPGTFHWASTLWHETSHVYALALTAHKVPRWFTEGLAVHEETAVSPEWGDRLTPEVIRAIKDKKLLPVSTLDRGFVHPSYPAQVVVSYFEAGQICDYIKEKFGWPTLLAMLKDFGQGSTTPTVIKTHLQMEPDDFDKQFMTWLDARVGSQVRGFEAWVKDVKRISELAKEKQWDDVIQRGTQALELYPDYVEAGSVYEFLADAYHEKKDPAAEAKVLMSYARAGGRNPATLKRLAALLEAKKDFKEAALALERINYIYPVLDEPMHTKQGELWLEAGNTEKAVREFDAAVHSAPNDTAGSYYNLARALRAAGRPAQARDTLFLALEAAPSFRPAQKMLLELSK